MRWSKECKSQKVESLTHHLLECTSYKVIREKYSSIFKVIKYIWRPFGIILMMEIY